MDIRTLDYHAAGEPLRIITDGLPALPGGSILERRRYMRDKLDAYRRFLMFEPRGHADMYGAVLMPPATADGDVGVLFLHNEGYSTMCGHGIIALVTAGIEHGLFEVADPAAIRIDTPAGRVTARANFGAGGGVESVSFINVPSFVLEPRVSVEVAGLSVDCTIAFGGAFYAYVDAELFGFELLPSESAEIIRLGQQVKEAVNRQCDIRHPAGDDDLNFLYGTIFVHAGAEAGRSRNACVFAQSELDRSPTGTGVSGRAAIHHARGEIGLGQELLVESIIGSAFRVRCLENTTVAGIPAVIPEVTGSAWMTGKHQFLLDQRDPLAGGFLLR
ncbi:MAG: proline racemase family protein [Xanthomonadales bacterium]|jgi:trans-L-3-hydroxyproline dehydratase|nr:proline racemase family protein [Xanthomonadales bacterium]